MCLNLIPEDTNQSKSTQQQMTSTKEAKSLYISQSKLRASILLANLIAVVKCDDGSKSHERVFRI